MLDEHRIDIAKLPESNYPLQKSKDTDTLFIWIRALLFAHLQVSIFCFKQHRSPWFHLLISPFRSRSHYRLNDEHILALFELCQYTSQYNTSRISQYELHAFMNIVLIKPR
jgi:hypothetical protein